MNNHKTVLFNGCSFTGDCGFLDANLKHRWSELFSKKYNLSATNIAIGGSSNDEIFYRCLDSILTCKPDLVVIMWSCISRRWEYFSNNNIDDFTILNNVNTKGFCADTTAAVEFAKLRLTYFNNMYVNFKKWLCYAIYLDAFLKTNQIDYIFLKGFDNETSELSRMFQMIQENHFDLTLFSDSIRTMFDHENRPDEFIIQKANELKLLYSTAKNLNWANFEDKSFLELKEDTADDRIHPGILTNQKLYIILSNYYEIMYA